MGQFIKDQTVNSYSAEIQPEIDTPEKRLEIVKKVVDQNFKRISDVKFDHLSEFEQRGEERTIYSPCIYWVYTFKTSMIAPPSVKEHTITLANYGGVDFNFHSFNIKYLNL